MSVGEDSGFGAAARGGAVRHRKPLLLAFQVLAVVMLLLLGSPAVAQDSSSNDGSTSSSDEDPAVGEDFPVVVVEGVRVGVTPIDPATEIFFAPNQVVVLSLLVSGPGTATFDGEQVTLTSDGLTPLAAEPSGGPGDDGDPDGSGRTGEDERADASERPSAATFTGDPARIEITVDGTRLAPGKSTFVHFAPGAALADSEADDGAAAEQVVLTLRSVGVAATLDNQTVNRGVAGSNDPIVTAGDCVAVTVDVVSEELISRSAVRVGYPTAIFEPETSGECRVPDGVVGGSGGHLTLPAVQAGSTVVPLRVRSDAANGPGTVTVELLRDGRGLAEVSADVLTLVAGIHQSVGGNPAGAVARLIPDTPFEVSLADPSGFPEGSVLRATYQSPLKPREVAGVTLIDTSAGTVTVPVGETIAFAVADADRPQGQGLSLQMHFEVMSDDAVLATGTTEQFLPAAVTVQQTLSVDGTQLGAMAGDADEGAATPTVEPNVSLSLVLDIKADAGENEPITIRQQFESAFFVMPEDGALADTQCREVGEPGGDGVGGEDPEGDPAEDGDSSEDGQSEDAPPQAQQSSRFECVTRVVSSSLSESQQRTYSVRVVPDLNVGLVNTTISGEFSVGDKEAQSLDPLVVGIAAPQVAVSVNSGADGDLRPGETSAVTVEVSNRGASVARGVTVQFSITEGADLLAEVVSPVGFEVSDGDVGEPNSLLSARTRELGDLQPGAVQHFQFLVQIAEDAESDAEVSWQADVEGGVNAIHRTSSVIRRPAGSSDAPDRLEDDKARLIIFTVLAPLIGLIALALTRRWVPGLAQVTLQRAIEGVLVIFLASTVLVMNLAGGLEAQSAAAIIGSIGGYLFGRGVSTVSAAPEPAAAPPPSGGGPAADDD